MIKYKVRTIVYETGFGLEQKLNEIYDNELYEVVAILKSDSKSVTILFKK